MNLIITCARHFEIETKKEVSKILDFLGDSEAEITITPMSGILTASSKLDPVEITKKIIQMVYDEPWSVRYPLRIIPIMKNTETKIEKILEEIPRLTNKINKNETYRISIEKRNSEISSQELISEIAKCIKNKVSLENPDKVILVELLGNITGISIIKPNEIFSIEKVKRKISEQD